MKLYIKYLLTFSLFFCLSGCSVLNAITMPFSHLPKDIAPNPSLYGQHRMEFDIGINGEERKEIGIGNINIKENQDLSQVYVRYYGIYSGVLYIKSEACAIDVAMNFEGVRVFKISDLIPKATRCSIRLTANTDKLNNRQHNIVESGEIKLNVLPEQIRPIQMEYTRTDSVLGTFYKTYTYDGQGSMQRQEGQLSQAETLTLRTPTDGGGTFRVTGCGQDNVFKGSYTGKEFKVKFSDVYKKDVLKREDSCDFEILSIPNNDKFSYIGRFSMSIYGKEAVKLEPMDVYVKYSRLFRKNYIHGDGNSYVTICSINDFYAIDTECSTRYYPDKIYWIRAITSNGRKSIFATKNKEIFWKE